MNPETFIQSVVKAYIDARKPHRKNEKVRRGRSHSISSVVEDLLADYLVQNDETIDSIYVDQPVTVADKKITIYPDIMVVRNGVVTALIDVKLDIGWHRNGLTELATKHRDMAISLRGYSCRLRDGVTKEIRNLEISQTLSYNIVMISRTNINPLILQKHETDIKELSPIVDLFILCDTGHPNSYEGKAKEIVKGLSVNQEVFNQLQKKLK